MEFSKGQIIKVSRTYNKPVYAVMRTETSVTSKLTGHVEITEEKFYEVLQVRKYKSCGTKIQVKDLEMGYTPMMSVDKLPANMKITEVTLSDLNP